MNVGFGEHGPAMQSYGRLRHCTLCLSAARLLSICSAAATFPVAFTALDLFFLLENENVVCFNEKSCFT